MIYTCERCGQEFKWDKHYQNHLQREDPCKKKISSKEDRLKFIDLFSGIGSFHNSFAKKGWECVMASDIDESTHKVYEENYNIKPLSDIYKINEKDISTYDILCAGFPCQPFSQAGKQKGLDDRRGIIFQEILRFAKYHKPKVLALENVSALLKHDKGNTFKIISDSIIDIGYDINYKITIICTNTITL